MSDQKSSRQLWKTLPGFAISAFFLWRTLTGIRFHDIAAIHVQHREWIAVLAFALFAGYTLRIFRWWLMLRSSGAPSFRACGRVLLTSFAANNVLPFRIGDFLRVFAYAEDLGSTPSSILGTVILERLLDMFMLLSFLTFAVATSPRLLTLPIFGHDVRILNFAWPVLLLVTLGVVAFLLFATLMESLVRRIMRAMPAGETITKIEKWLLLAFDAVKQMSATEKLGLLVTSFLAWVCEGTIFVAAAKLMGLGASGRGPWLALSLSNLSYLIPSSPGAIGTFEYFCKFGMVSQDAATSAQAALYGLLVHVIVLLTITAAGGIAFLLHRSHRRGRRPLADEIHDLPQEMPQA